MVKENNNRIDSVIVYDRDFNLDYFGFKTLECNYLMKIDDIPSRKTTTSIYESSIGNTH